MCPDVDTSKFEAALDLAIDATETGDDNVVETEVDAVFGEGFSDFAQTQLPEVIAVAFLAGAFAVIVNTRPEAE